MLKNVERRTALNRASIAQTWGSEFLSVPGVASTECGYACGYFQRHTQPYIKLFNTLQDNFSGRRLHQLPREKPLISGAFFMPLLSYSPLVSTFSPRKIRMSFPWKRCRTLGIPAVGEPRSS